MISRPFTATILAALVMTSAAGAAAQAPRPNVIVIFLDDLGYGDFGCYGHPTIRTPHIDRMAAEGLRFTQFYSAAEVCTPSRAALMTGRLPIRSGMCSDSNRVLRVDSSGGLPDEEFTLAEGLQFAGYDTACIGKWHLGSIPRFFPTANGFDSFFGTPYSNDMNRSPDAPRGRAAFHSPKSEYFNVPLYRGTEVVEQPVDQTTITKRYTDEAVTLIQERAASDDDDPFFIYLAHNLPHVPLFRGETFENVSRRGVYGDVVEEIDHGVGRILETLRETGFDENTIVWLSSDNGPWLTFGVQGGSAGLLRGGKGSTFEGGMRVPGIAWWPGRIEPGVTAELASTLDLLPTLCALAGVELPSDRFFDGYDLAPLLFEGKPSPRKEMYFYRGATLYALRQGPWKAHFITQKGYGGKAKRHDPPVLHHLGHDPSEEHNLAKVHPQVVARLEELAEKHRGTVKAPPSQLELPPVNSPKSRKTNGKSDQ